MTRKELKEHSERQIELCELFAADKGEKPSGKVYEEHKLILELLEQEPLLDNISVEIRGMDYLTIEDGSGGYDYYVNRDDVSKIIDKYKAESEE